MNNFKSFFTTIFFSFSFYYSAINADVEKTKKISSVKSLKKSKKVEVKKPEASGPKLSLDTLKQKVEAKFYTYDIKHVLVEKIEPDGSTSYSLEKVATKQFSIPTGQLLLGLFLVRILGATLVNFFQKKKSSEEMTSFFENSCLHFESEEVKARYKQGLILNDEENKALTNLINGIKAYKVDESGKIIKDVPRGGIFFGAPGTGKTESLYKIAVEGQCIVLKLSSADISSSYVNGAKTLIKEIYEKAVVLRKIFKRPVLVFLDDIEGIKRNMGDPSESNSARERSDADIIGTMLSLLTDSRYKGICTIIATNFKPSDFDPALVRDERLSRHIEIKLPDQKTREKLIQLFKKRYPSAPVSSHSDLVSLTDDMTPAEIQSLFKVESNDAITAQLEKIKSQQEERARTENLRLARYQARTGLKKELLTLYENFDKNQEKILAIEAKLRYLP